MHGLSLEAFAFLGGRVAPILFVLTLYASEFIMPPQIF